MMHVLREEDVKKEEKVSRIDVGKEAAIEAEVKAARERAIIPLEIRMKQFRDMLAEKEVFLEISEYRLVLYYHANYSYCWRYHNLL